MKAQRLLITMEELLDRGKRSISVYLFMEWVDRSSWTVLYFRMLWLQSLFYFCFQNRRSAQKALQKCRQQAILLPLLCLKEYLSIKKIMLFSLCKKCRWSDKTCHFKWPKLTALSQRNKMVNKIYIRFWKS